jgi:hypothetical protein
LGISGFLGSISLGVTSSAGIFTTFSILLGCSLSSGRFSSLLSGRRFSGGLGASSLFGFLASCLSLGTSGFSGLLVALFLILLLGLFVIALLGFSSLLILSSLGLSGVLILLSLLVGLLGLITDLLGLLITFGLGLSSLFSLSTLGIGESLGLLGILSSGLASSCGGILGSNSVGSCFGL